MSECLLSGFASDRPAPRAPVVHRDLAALTPREREVLPLVVSGLLNKQAAAELGRRPAVPSAGPGGHEITDFGELIDAQAQGDFEAIEATISAYGGSRSTMPVTPPRSPGLRRVLDAVVADPGGNHTLAAMAERLAVSERHVTRLFRREVGGTPGQYVERVRLEAAQAMLESCDAGVNTIARACGFGTDETMRRVFLRVLNAPPAAYRERFRASASSARASRPDRPRREEN